MSIEWYTPPRIIACVRNYFDGTISLDPATSADNPTGATKFYTQSDNGLQHSWSGRVFCNPPYGKVLRDWVQKISAEAACGTEIVALLPGQRFEQEYWQQSLFTPKLKALVAVRGRVSFLRPNGVVVNGNPYGSFLYCLNGSYERAAPAFAPIGMVMEVGRVTQHARHV